MIDSTTTISPEADAVMQEVDMVTLLQASHASDEGSRPVNESVSMPNDEPEHWTELSFTWSGKIFQLSVADTDRVYDLKAYLHDLTNVPPERQKILGLVKGKLPEDQVRISDLRLPAGKKFTLVGTPEGDEIKDPSQLEALPDVINDFDIDFTDDPKAVEAYINDLRNKRKVTEMTEKVKINMIHPFREGKKLLVLDIDYTILDTKPLTSGTLPPSTCARPGLHEFLEAVYPFYDICIWSQTSWIWLETKLVELGMIGSSYNYQIAFGEVKQALQIIWNHFSQFNASNTIHVDDLSRNFALNPGEGLKISAFKNAHTAESMSDRELRHLTRYLLHIANVNDFRPLKHKHWKHIARLLPGSD